MVVRLSPPVTAEGAIRSTKVPSPMRPSPLYPQHHAAEEVSIEQLCEFPAVITEPKVGPPVWKVATGTSVEAAVLSPSWPPALRPQHQLCPAEVRPQACVSPTSMVTNGLVGVTVIRGETGVADGSSGSRSEQAERRAAASTGSSAARWMERGFMGASGRGIGIPAGRSAGGSML